MDWTQIFIWVGFNVFVLAMLALDLGVFHRKEHTVGVRESLIWTAVWIILALLFGVGMYFVRGSEPALEYLTGYVIEKALSMDNIFVFLVIFRYFGVAGKHQHRVLFWGIIGALVFRAIFIFAGVALLHQFHWMIYVLGAFLVIVGIRTAWEGDRELEPDKNPVLRFARRHLRIAETDHSGSFLIRRNGRLFATPLLLVLIVIETTDVVFALDSIPAILAITTDPFIVYSSNVFAILGLRALYFALAGLMERIRFLHYGLAAVLVFVGIKMLIEGVFHIPVGWSLAIVATMLSVSVIASLLFPGKRADRPPGADERPSPVPDESTPATGEEGER